MEAKQIAKIGLQMLKNAVLVVLLEAKGRGDDPISRSLTMTQISKRLGMSPVMHDGVLTYDIVPDIVRRCESKGYVTPISKWRWKMTDIGEAFLQKEH